MTHRPLNNAAGEQPNVSQWRLAILSVCLLPSAFCLSCCSHPPETALELKQRLPAQYQGEIHLQGETESHRVVLEAHDLIERSLHVLEFGKVRYQFFTGANPVASGEASIRGTVSTPELVIGVEDLGVEGGGDFLKAGSFQGTFSKDLKTVDASWTTSFGQKVTFKAKAQP